MNPLSKIISSREAELEEKSARLFTHPQGGLSVLLDYPPHDRVLDEKLVASFHSQSLLLLLQGVNKELAENVKGKFGVEQIIAVDNLQAFINQSIEELKAK